MKKIVCFCLVLVLILSFAGCTAADNVNLNISTAPNNFQCFRRITVYNARTDMLVMEMEGLMSISNNQHKKLVVTCKTGENTYKKNYVYLNDYVIYVVEDITGIVTDPYHYKVHFYVGLPDIDIN